MSTSVAQAQLLEANQNKPVHSEARRNLGAVTSLRFLACLLVLFCHSFAMFGVDLKVRGQDIAYWQGLTCFFVISGFIMVYVHPSLPNIESTMRFFVARFARIFPTHFVSFLAFIAIFPASLTVPNAALYALFNLTMTHAWTLSKPIYSSYNTPSWSLSVEIFFYLAFPFMLHDLKKTWRWKLVVSLLLALSQVGLCTLDVLPKLKSFESSAPAFINIDPLSRMFEFMVGMALALYFKRENALAKLDVFRTTLVEVLAFAIVIACVLMPNWWQADNRVLWLEPFRSWMHYCGAGPAYGFLIVMMAISRGLISRLLEHRAFVYLGELSFSSYLFHYPVLLFFTFHLPKFMARNNVWVVEAVWLVAVIGIAAINYKFVEMPARRALISWFDSTKWSGRVRTQV